MSLKSTFIFHDEQEIVEPSIWVRKAVLAGKWPLLHSKQREP